MAATTGLFELTAIATGGIQSDDVLALVDVHDAAQAPQGSVRKATLATLFRTETTAVTVSTPLPDIAQKWNAGGVTFTAVKLNVTDTASAAGSLLVDLQVGGVSKWSVTKAGAVTQASSLTVTAGGATIAAGGLTVSAGTTAVQALTATTITGTATAAGSFKFGDATFGDGVASLYGNAETQNIVAIKTSAAYSTNAGKALIVESSAGSIVFSIAGNGAITALPSSVFAIELANDGTSPRIQSYASKTLYINQLGNPVNINGATTIASGGLTVSAGGATITAGNLGIGAAPLANEGLQIAGAILSGSVNQYGFVSNAVFSSGATTSGTAAYLAVVTPATAFTMSVGYGAYIDSAFKGAGSTITTLYGLYVNSQTQGATNYAIYTNTGPVSLGDSLTVRTGGLTVTAGGLTVTAGGLTVSAGTTAVQALTATTGSFSSTLSLTAATSKIIPGATSLSLRNNADSADNMLVTDAGAVTFRSTVGGITTLTATTLAGTLSTAAQPNVTSLGTLTSLTVSGTVTLTAAASKIVPGATSLSLRNTADSADNLILTDAGAATFRNTVTSALGTITADAQTFSGTATWNNAGVLFTAFKINVTNTASNGGSYLMDLQVGGVSKLVLDITGTLQPANNLSLPVGNILFSGNRAGKIVPPITSLSLRNNADSADNLLMTDAGVATFRSTAITAASTASAAGLRLPHGSAPSVPTDGDMWTTTAGAFIRINGVTKTFTLT